MVHRKILLILFWAPLLATVVHSMDVISTIGGNGTQGFSGDSGVALSAALNNPAGIAFDQARNILIVDRDNNRIRQIGATNRVITTLAGNGTAVFGGDNGSPASASLNAPSGIAVANGDIYIADTANHRIRKISGATQNIITVAGNGTATFAGDNLLATSASLNAPQGVFVDASGNIFIADTGNNRIRKVNGLTNIITTVAGTGTAGALGDGGLATAAQLNAPVALTADSNGLLYIADSANHRIRRIDGQSNIATFAGNGTAAFSGDNGAAASASLNTPSGIALDTSNNLIIADTLNHRIRRVIALTNIISTLAGAGAGFSGDGNDPTQALLNGPRGLTLDASNSIYIADTNNQRIRSITPFTTITIINVSASAAPSPARTTVPVAFTASATDTMNLPLTFSWNFGDGSPAVTGATVNHAFALENTYTVIVTISDTKQSVTSPISLLVQGPNSGADGVKNVSNGVSVMNPVDSTAIAIPGSNGGVLDFTGTAKALAAQRAGSQISFSIDDGVNSTPVLGATQSHKFVKGGLFISTAQAVDTGSGGVVGRMRKTVAISDRELGQAKYTQPNAKISGIALKGKVFLKGALSSDTITFTGTFEMPGGLDASKDIPVSVSIANIIDTVTVQPKNAGANGSIGFVSGFKIKYHSNVKKAPVLPPQQTATLSWKVAGVGLVTKGLDTEGISLANLAAMDKKGTSVNIQIEVAIDGETYEVILPVNFKIPSVNSTFGNITIRSGQVP